MDSWKVLGSSWAMNSGGAADLYKRWCVTLNESALWFEIKRLSAARNDRHAAINAAAIWIPRGRRSQASGLHELGLSKGSRGMINAVTLVGVHWSLPLPLPLPLWVFLCLCVRVSRVHVCGCARVWLCMYVAVDVFERVRARLSHRCVFARAYACAYGMRACVCARTRVRMHVCLRLLQLRRRRRLSPTLTHSHTHARTHQQARSRRRTRAGLRAHVHIRACTNVRAHTHFVRLGCGGVCGAVLGWLGGALDWEEAFFYWTR